MKVMKISELMDILKNINPDNSIEFVNMGKNGYTYHIFVECIDIPSEDACQIFIK